MRIDCFLHERWMAKSRSEAQSLIREGLVSVGGKTVLKPAYDVDPLDSSVIVTRMGATFASRGGKKLQGALLAFSLNVEGRYAIDVGASTGGFTDCLLQAGAREVYAVDSGSGQLVESLRADRRVHVLENYNARYMVPSDFSYLADLAVMDVSFISATCIIPALSACLCEGADFICLVKPQFEVGREGLGKGGIVKDDKARAAALKKVISFAAGFGLEAKGAIVSPITGGDGNIEYLVHFKKLGGDN